MCVGVFWFRLVLATTRKKNVSIVLNRLDNRKRKITKSYKNGCTHTKQTKWTKIIFKKKKNSFRIKME